MKKSIQKLVQKIYCRRAVSVTDVDTRKKEDATYHMVLGLPMKIEYKPKSSAA